MDYKKLIKKQDKFIKSNKLLDFDFDLSKDTEKNKEIIKSYQTLYDSKKMQFSMFSIETFEGISYYLSDSFIICIIPHVGDALDIDNTRFRIFLKDGTILTKKGNLEINNILINTKYFSHLYLHDNAIFKAELDNIDRKDIKKVNLITKIGLSTPGLRKELIKLNDDFIKKNKRDKE